jgi:two-component system, NarL family, nitrate/nitrite response regulator NarL
MSTEKQAPAGAGRLGFCPTPREKQVLALLVAGYTDKDIAREFGVSEQTIKVHVASISARLGVANRLELLLFALHHRLFDHAQVVSPIHGTPPRSWSLRV